VLVTKIKNSVYMMDPLFCPLDLPDAGITKFIPIRTLIYDNDVLANRGEEEEIINK
jgi:hypothetical protein